ncbi:hypothetical protein [Salinisphaera aquimarina]|uniref:Uncharacterized protein n=1 Tax=Salinisphaera aquimarina TaxID=2094031 RepID=A0ABV7ESE9_9GAMM
MAVVDPTRGDASLNLVLSLENLGKWLMAGAVFFALTGACIVLAKLMYRFDQVYGFYALFDLGSDSSIPTWFSSLGLLACSLLLWTHSLVEDPAQRVMCWQWLFLALIFLLLSVDEVARIHEVLGTSVGQELVPDVSDRSGGLLSYQWLVCGVIFTSAIALAYIPFLYRLPRRVALGFILAGGSMSAARWSSSLSTDTLNIRLAHAARCIFGGRKLRSSSKWSALHYLRGRWCAIFRSGLTCCLCRQISTAAHEFIQCTVRLCTGGWRTPLHLASSQPLCSK